MAIIVSAPSASAGQTHPRGVNYVLFRGTARRQVVEWDSDDKVWVIHVAALDNLSSYGATGEAALESTRETIAGYLEAAAKDGIPLPHSPASQRASTKHSRA